MDPALCCESCPNPASSCCCCLYPLPLLCSFHLTSMHAMDPDSFLHFHLPLEAIDVIRSKQDWRRWSVRLFTLHCAYKDLRENLKEMDLCDQTLDTAESSLSFLGPSSSPPIQSMKSRLSALRSSFESELQLAISTTCHDALRDVTYPPGSLPDLISRYNDFSSTLKLFDFEVGVDEYALQRICRVRLSVSLPSLAHFGVQTEDIAVTLMRQKEEIDSLQAEITAKQLKETANIRELNSLHAELKAKQLVETANIRELDSLHAELKAKQLVETANIRELDALRKQIQLQSDYIITLKKEIDILRSDQHKLLLESGLSEESQASTHAVASSLSESQVNPLPLPMPPPSPPQPAPSQNAPVVNREIQVRDHTGVVRSIDFSPAFTVETVKYKLAAICFLPVDQQILRHSGTVLENHQTLGFYDIQPTSELTLSKRHIANAAQLHIRTEFGVTYSMGFSPLVKISDVKKRLSDTEGIPETLQMLSYGENDLMNGSQLKDYKVPRGGTIYLTIAPNAYNISVAFPGGKQAGMQITFQTSLKEVKRRLSTLSHVPEDFISVAFAGNLIEDTAILGLCGVRGGSTLQIEYKPVKMFAIYLKKTYVVEGGYWTTVAEISQHLKGMIGIDEDIMVTYAESRMENDQNIGYYGLREGCTLRALACPPGKNEIYVKTQSGDTFLMEYLETTTVGAVKDYILKKEGIEEGQRDLVHAGKFLSDEKTLRECFVQRGSTIYVVARQEVD